MKKKYKRPKETPVPKEEQEEKMSDYLKELLKPENLLGPFDSTAEMMKSLLEGD